MFPVQQVNNMFLKNVFFKIFTFFGLLFGIIFTYLIMLIYENDYTPYFPQSIFAGLLFGIIGALMLSNSYKSISIELEYEDKDDFLQKITTNLRKYDIILIQKNEKYVRYKPRFRYHRYISIYFVITMEIFHNYVVIMGPVKYLNKLLKNSINSM